MRYLPLFIAIQLASLVLTVLGVPICAFLAYTNQARVTSINAPWHWPRWAWLWDNNEDGTWPAWYHAQHPNWSVAHVEFFWTALRNPCNNLRYVPGVSRIGRPLWRKTWRFRGKPYYAQAGWNGSGFPVLSAGFDIHAGA